ncbi:hypothetical protein [Gluconobacter sp.]|uniref:hypothetical protein n=1 Tax=Gluconobacter sp. TaxID=1876758 RepID=UPI0039EABCB8
MVPIKVFSKAWQILKRCHFSIERPGHGHVTETLKENSFSAGIRGSSPLFRATSRSVSRIIGNTMKLAFAAALTLLMPKKLTLNGAIFP